MTFQPTSSLLSWFIATEWKQFSTIHCALLASVWPNKYPPLLNTISTEADVHRAQKVHSNNGFRMANCFCCLLQNGMVCFAHCRQELQQKSWKTARLFLQDRDQDQMFKTTTKTSMIQEQDQDLSFLSSKRLETKTSLEDYITDDSYRYQQALNPGLLGASQPP